MFMRERAFGAIPILRRSARGVIAGFGPLSYLLALEALFDNETRKI